MSTQFVGFKPTVTPAHTWATTLRLHRAAPAAATSSTVAVAAGRQADARPGPSELFARWDSRYSAGFFDELARRHPDALLALLRDLRPGYVVLALESAQEHLGPEAYRTDVLALIEHRSPMVREAAVYALAKEPSDHVRRQLARLADRDPSEAVREAAGSLFRVD